MADNQYLKEAIKIIEYHLDKGVSYGWIASQTGISRRILYNIGTGRSKTVRPEQLESLKRTVPDLYPEKQEKTTREDFVLDREATLALIKQNQELIELVKKMLDEK